MKSGLVTSTLAVLLVAFSAGAQDVTVYSGATLVDGNGGSPVANGIIVVEGSRIVGIGPAESVGLPDGAEIIDVSGSWIMPGLIDTHVHFFESGRLYFNPVISAVFGDQATEDAWVRQRLDYTLSRYLCSGVTTLVSLGGPEEFEMLARERSRILEYAPQVLVAGGPIGESPVDMLTFEGGPTTLAARTEEQMRETIRDIAAKEMDLVKLGYLGPLGSGEPLSIEEYAPVLSAAADEADKFGLPVITHIMSREAAEGITGTGLDAYAHLPFDDIADDEFAAEVAEKGIAIAPTLAVFPRELAVLSQQLELLPIEHACADPEVIETYDDMVEGGEYGSWSWNLLGIAFVALAIGVALWRWKRFRIWTKVVAVPFLLIGAVALYLSPIGNFVKFVHWAYDGFAGEMSQYSAENMRRLVDAGAPLIVGSDSSHVGTPHGTSMHVEMQMIQDEGVSASTIVSAASRNAAEVLGIADQTGTLEVGKQADFLILGADPTVDIANAQQIRFVVSDGRLFSSVELAAEAMH